MCSRLQGEKTPRYLRKCLLHRFRCHRDFLFQKDSSPFIQNAVTRRAISKIHTDRQPLLLENFTLEYLYSANLLHSRSPFLCASSTSIIGSVSHPAGDRPSHPNLINGSQNLLRPQNERGGSKLSALVTNDDLHLNLAFGESDRFSQAIGACDEQVRTRDDNAPCRNGRSGIGRELQSPSRGVPRSA